MRRQQWRARRTVPWLRRQEQVECCALERCARNSASRVWSLAVALLIAVTAALVPGRWIGADAAQTSWQVASQRTVDFGDKTHIVSLSPDGRWLTALPAFNTICLYDVVTLRQA
jgi:hypothetical protein